jgi:hypothetical protein
MAALRVNTGEFLSAITLKRNSNGLRHKSFDDLTSWLVKSGTKSGVAATYSEVYARQRGK